MIDIYLQTFCSFQPTFRFHMPFLTFKARIISAQQIEQSWCLETYKLFAPTQKQLAHPLFSSYSVLSSWRKSFLQLQRVVASKGGKTQWSDRSYKCNLNSWNSLASIYFKYCNWYFSHCMVDKVLWSIFVMFPFHNQFWWCSRKRLFQYS